MATKTYVTIQGDTYESIAWFQMGDSNYMTDLIEANRKYFDVAVFEAGVELTIPEVAEKKTLDETTPPWRR